MMLILLVLERVIDTFEDDVNIQLYTMSNKSMFDRLSMILSIICRI
jgi:hypothetical protein